LKAIGFVGFGEVASRFAEALAMGGAKVLAYDVLMDQDGGRAKLEARVRGPAPEFVPLAELAARADLVLCTVTTDVALAAARSCAPLLRRGQAYVDLNATSPAVKREIGAVVGPSGADFVEGAILPLVNVTGARSQVLVCGTRAGAVATAVNALGLNFRDFGPDIGRASSFKLLRSVFSKGVEALLVECLLAGRRAGVEADLWREIVGTVDAASFEEVGGNWVRTHGTAHARRWHEMVQVAELLQGLGVDALMTRGTVAVFERSTRAALKDAFAAPPSTPADVIAALEQRLTGSRPSPG
jgi:3-hydroxyisobutyrate dehydrogenase-like beta-hydroxyacid dehydrogenase